MTSSVIQTIGAVLGSAAVTAAAAYGLSPDTAERQRQVDYGVGILQDVIDDMQFRLDGAKAREAWCIDRLLEYTSDEAGLRRLLSPPVVEME